LWQWSFVIVFEQFPHCITDDKSMPMDKSINIVYFYALKIKDKNQ